MELKGRRDKRSRGDLEKQHLPCRLSEEAAIQMGYHIIQDWPSASTDLNPIK
jgi:hypothetical protein